jgi:hypothetical protein
VFLLVLIFIIFKINNWRINKFRENFPRFIIISIAALSIEVPTYFILEHQVGNLANYRLIVNEPFYRNIHRLTIEDIRILKEKLKSIKELGHSIYYRPCSSPDLNLTGEILKRVEKLTYKRQYLKFLKYIDRAG